MAKTISEAPYDPVWGHDVPPDASPIGIRRTTELDEKPRTSKLAKEDPPKGEMGVSADGIRFFAWPMPNKPADKTAEALLQVDFCSSHCEALIERLRALNGISNVPGVENPALDQRWVQIGMTHLQQGFMALERAINKPAGF